MKTVLSFAMGGALALAAPAAWAQEAGGAVGGTAAVGVEAPKASVAAPAAAPRAVRQAAADDRDDGISDHEKYAVGHLAVGYLGLTNLPIATGTPTALGTRGNVAAPVVGVRYWLSEKLGIDAGLGFALASGSADTVNGSNTVSTDSPSIFGLALHGGVPLVFAHHKHYKFLVVPELNVGFATSTQSVPNAPAGVGDITRSGFHLDVGGRVGAEVHFGFIGVPHLSLQATVGVFARRDAWKVKQDVPNGTTSSSQGETAFGTSVQSDPWALFVNNISALYYFP